MEISVKLKDLKKILKIKDENLLFRGDYHGIIRAVVKRGDLEVSTVITSLKCYILSEYFYIYHWSSDNITIFDLEGFKEQVLLALSRANNELDKLL